MSLQKKKIQFKSIKQYIIFSFSLSVLITDLGCQNPPEVLQISRGKIH